MESGSVSWDVKKSPGTRAYRANNVDGALEPALMADGVPPVAVFWSSGAQQAQLMKDAEVDMTTGWNDRWQLNSSARASKYGLRRSPRNR